MFLGEYLTWVGLMLVGTSRVGLTSLTEARA